MGENPLVKNLVDKQSFALLSQKGLFLLTISRLFRKSKKKLGKLDYIKNSFAQKIFLRTGSFVRLSREKCQKINIVLSYVLKKRRLLVKMNLVGTNNLSNFNVMIFLIEMNQSTMRVSNRSR
jgi:hypothetical protein